MTKIRHTKSTSGRTHVLLIDDKPVIALRYATAPQFDDQVQGDLIRQYWAEGGEIKPIGLIPDSPRVDPRLDKEESEHALPTPASVATDVLNAHAIRSHWQRSGAQIHDLIVEAIEKDRASYFQK